MARPAQHEEPRDERLHFAWVMIDAGHFGWKWARMLVPQSVVDEHLVGEIVPGGEGGLSRPLVAAKIEADITSDRILDRRGWGPT